MLLDCFMVILHHNPGIERSFDSYYMNATAFGLIYFSDFGLNCANIITPTCNSQVAGQ